MAQLLDESNVVSATMNTQDFGASYMGSGVGWAEDDEGPLSVMVLSYASISSATDNLERVTASFDSETFGSGRPLGELLMLESIDQRDSEIVALVRFVGDANPQVPLELMFRQDGPFAR